MRISEKAILPTGAISNASIIVAFAVYSTEDERGTRGGLVGVYTNRTAAEQANRTAGWYGGDGRIDEVNVLVLADGRKFVLDEIKQFKELDINLIDDYKNRVAAARAKLSDEEAALLGIK